MQDLSQIIDAFSFQGQVVKIAPYGNGHINDTVRVTTDAGVEYIMQRINTSVFCEPERLMDNVVAVVDYLRARVAAEGGDPDREALCIVRAKDGKSYHRTADGQFWRAEVFIPDSVSYDKAQSPEQFYRSAVAFGGFQYLLRDFPADTLYETIPDFHNTPDRYRQLMEAVEADRVGRRSTVEAEIAFAMARQAFTETLETAHKEGRLPLRVTHNDTKLNNILFDTRTGEALCIIDLDTIMPGYSVNDFGDSIRFGATTALEDETDLSVVHFDLALFSLYVKGFLEGVRGGLTPGEIALLPDAAIMMTLECGMRFLTDYLNGDTYFKISREHHNLDRARNQFKLVADMEQSLEQMRRIVTDYVKA